MEEKIELFLIFQSIPGCIPWGFFALWFVTYFVRSTDMPIFTAMIFAAAFGLGNPIGTLIAGIWETGLKGSTEPLG